jgi:hypothetical protein
MLSQLSRIIQTTCVQSCVLASSCRNALFGLLGVFLLFCPVGARADIYYVTITNATFTATCIGGSGTCTEIINGTGFYDPVTNTASDVSVSFTGTLNGSLDIYGTPTCTASGCIPGPILYDAAALPGFNPIEFSPDIDNFNAPTPQPLLAGPTGAELFVPGQCGGDQPACNTTGAFPGNGAIDYFLTSGTYTSVDVGPSPVPEPGSFILLTTGAGMLGLLSRRRV